MADDNNSTLAYAPRSPDLSSISSHPVPQRSGHTDSRVIESPQRHQPDTPVLEWPNYPTAIQATGHQDRRHSISHHYIPPETNLSQQSLQSQFQRQRQWSEGTTLVQHHEQSSSCGPVNETFGLSGPQPSISHPYSGEATVSHTLHDLPHPCPFPYTPASAQPFSLPSSMNHGGIPTPIPDQPELPERWAPGGIMNDKTQGLEINVAMVRTKFPTARIKRIMQADEEVGKVAQSTPIAVGKALELFMIQLVTKSADVARQKGSKRVSAQMLKEVIEHDDQWDFLRDIASKVEETEKKSKPARTDGSDSEEDDLAPGKRRGRGGRKKKAA